jgi:hypothetical protein
MPGMSLPELACACTSVGCRTSTQDDGKFRHIRGVDWEFNAYGGNNGGGYSPWDKVSPTQQLGVFGHNVAACQLHGGQ